MVKDCLRIREGVTPTIKCPEPIVFGWQHLPKNWLLILTSSPECMTRYWRKSYVEQLLESDDGMTRFSGIFRPANEVINLLAVYPIANWEGSCCESIASSTQLLRSNQMSGSQQIHIATCYYSMNFIKIEFMILCSGTHIFIERRINRWLNPD